MQKKDIDTMKEEDLMVNQKNINFMEDDEDVFRNEFGFDNENMDVDSKERDNGEVYGDVNICGEDFFAQNPEEDSNIYRGLKGIIEDYCWMTEKMTEEKKENLRELLSAYYEYGITVSDAIELFNVCISNLAKLSKDSEIEYNNIGIICEIIYSEIETAKRKKFLELLVESNFDRKLFLIEGDLRNDLVPLEKEIKKENEMLTLRKKKMIISINEDEGVDQKVDNKQKPKGEILNKKDIDECFLGFKRK